MSNQAKNKKLRTLAEDMMPWEVKQAAIVALAESLNPIPIREAIEELEKIAERKEREAGNV